MGRKLTVEERIKRIEENRERLIASRLEKVRKHLNAVTDAKIDLLREKGVPQKPARSPGRSLDVMMAKAEERYKFFRYRYYIHIGVPEAEARQKAAEDYAKYRLEWTRSLNAA